jgi:hypothetical protein
VYTVSGGKNIPAWLSDKKKKALRKDDEYRRRIELIQDFEFPAGCQRIKVTPDGQHIFASGYHPPQARLFSALAWPCLCGWFGLEVVGVKEAVLLPAQMGLCRPSLLPLSPPFLHSPKSPHSPPAVLTSLSSRCGATTCPSCP